MPQSLAHRTLRGVIWSFTERFSSQAIGFAVILIMARLLTPSDYGLVGMLTIFIQLGGTLCDSGTSQALIRLRERTESDVTTVFCFNVAFGVLLYLLLWGLAPHIASYYEEPQLCSLARVTGLIIPVSSLMVVQKALLSSEMDFRTQTRASLVAQSLSGIVGIYMAYKGWGVWSIVCYQLSSQGLLCLMLWILRGWLPRGGFSVASFRSLFGFSARLGAADILDILYRNLYLLVIGKVYRAADLGYFTRAQQIGGFLSANVSFIVHRVSYPSLCGVRDDISRLRRNYMLMLSVSSIFIFPIMWCIIVMSPEVVELLLGPRWSAVSSLLPILSLGFIWHHVQSLNIQLLQIFGRGDLYLKVEIIKKIGGLGLLAVSVSYGLEAICWSFVVASLFSIVCNTWYSGRLFGLGLLRQLKRVGPTFLVAAVSATAGMFVSHIVHHSGLRVIIALVVEFILFGSWILCYRRSDILPVYDYLCRRGGKE